MLSLVRAMVVFTFLFGLKVFSRLLYRHDLGWVGEVPDRPLRDIRLVALLHHTSLYEFLFAGSVPNAFLWQVARHGVVPVADKTIQRPVVGAFFRAIAANVVPISRQRDHTWHQVLEKLGPRSLLIILPEGRMMRKDGLDKRGRAMTVRGGIADILEAIPHGPFLIAYSGGLHHVQAPGDRWPKLFQRIRMRFEQFDVADYREARRREAEQAGTLFKRAVIQDLARRRDEHSYRHNGFEPPAPRTPPRESTES